MRLARWFKPCDFNQNDYSQYIRLNVKTFRRGRLKNGCFLGLVVLLLAGLNLSGRTPPDASDPVVFFSSVADKLLRSTFSFGVTNIPVCSNGVFVYSPAVQRILQLSANVCDASNTNFFPTVFRPIFTNDGTNIFISGYQQIVSVPNPPSFGQLPATQLPLSAPVDVTYLLLSGAGTYSNNIYGVPWIIGAKKGLPGFNQFSMVNTVQFERLLQLVRPSVGGPVSTNQMIVMSGNNNVGVSFWNSYSNDYAANYPTNLGSPNLTVYVSHTIRMVLTNSDWMAPYHCLFTTNFTFNLTNWPGSKWGTFGSGTPAANSFFVNLWTNNFIPQAVYNIPNRTFAITTNTQSFWDATQTTLYPLPQFGLLTTNWLQAVILDNGHVIDYVQLRGPINNANLNSALNDPSPGGPPNFYLWVTNAYGAGTMPSWGIVDQIEISSIQGAAAPPSAQWKNPNVKIPGLSDLKAASQVFFGAFSKPNSIYQYVTDAGPTRYYTNSQLVVQAPYTATRTILVPYLYQVNDPLVHYLASDLDAGAGAVWQNNFSTVNGVWSQSDNPATAPIPTPPTTSIGRYQPWSKAAPNAFQSTSYNFQNPYSLIYKDPLVWSADYWNFPTNLLASPGGLGQVHRGTPWQTVYLKAHNVLHTLNLGAVNSGTNTWMAWTGDYDFSDAALTAPVNDRQLVSFLAALLNTNTLSSQFSVNNPDANAWAALFDGLVALTNTVPNFIYRYINVPPTNSLIVISSNSAQVSLIVNAIQSTRAVQTNQLFPSHVFQDIGAILATVQLTEQSPFLNWNNAGQQQKGIGDEVYEAIPAQLLPLLRPDSIGAMLPTNGGWDLQYSGSDVYAYALQTSTNLVNWDTVSTNYPVQGCFHVSPLQNSSTRYYRTVLLP
jgi:hypothetical protein